ISTAMSRDHRNIHASVGVSGDPLSTNIWSPEWPRALFARNTVCRITRCMMPERVKHRSQVRASGNYRRTSVPGTFMLIMHFLRGPPQLRDSLTKLITTLMRVPLGCDGQPWTENWMQEDERGHKNVQRICMYVREKFIDNDGRSEMELRDKEESAESWKRR
ncbi:hypothetical protein CBL_10539, partial [Carabus blaptoides fortunei]